MKKLSDKQFDDLLRQKAESSDYGFDESAWEKMEQKLRRRDRVIFIRNSSFALILVLLAGGVFLFLTDKDHINQTIKLAKETKRIQKELNVTDSSEEKTEPAEEKEINSDSTRHVKSNLKHNIISVRGSYQNGPDSLSDFVQNNVDETLINIQKTGIIDNNSAIAITRTESVITPHTDFYSANNQEFIITDTGSPEKEENGSLKKRKQWDLSITALAGPEFSAIKSIAGSRGTITIGLLLNTSLSDKITLSSGLRYGPKNYQATPYNYQLQNPARANQISAIDASCNILEIPLQASYSLIENSGRKITISSGLSSYLMLKEKYNFRYTPQSGRDDFLLVRKNANQHYLSVLSLSASYHIKSKSSPVQWAIEPYIKLPLEGVGEGNVRLKSSGISLNLSYDISKKNK